MARKPFEGPQGFSFVDSTTPDLHALQAAFRCLSRRCSSCHCEKRYDCRSPSVLAPTLRDQHGRQKMRWLKQRKLSSFASFNRVEISRSLPCSIVSIR